MDMRNSFFGFYGLGKVIRKKEIGTITMESRKIRTTA
jgi:hypothetical protein